MREGTNNQNQSLQTEYPTELKMPINLKIQIKMDKIL